MVNYVSQERLLWGPVSDAVSSSQANKALIPRNPVPFADDADYKILRNDWPYGCDPGIHHLVVWMKTRVPVNPEDGSLVESSREMIDAFVRDKFAQRLLDLGQGKDQVQWFKNWTALQSVAALEHFHVLVRDVSEDMLVSWTGETASKREQVQKSV